MADEYMNKKLTLPTNEKPSVINDSFFKGWFFGELAGSLIVGIAGIGAIASLPAMLISSAISFGFALAGGLIAGNTGKDQMQRDLESGKEVKSPTFWNKNIFKGLFLADLIGTAIIYATKIPVLAGATPELTNMAEAIGGLAAVGITAWGLIAGGLSGKHKMQEEYDQALRLRDTAQQVGRGNEISQAAGIELTSPELSAYKNSVPSGEMATLNARLKQNDIHTAAFAAKLEFERQNTNPELVALKQ